MFDSILDQKPSKLQGIQTMNWHFPKTFLVGGFNPFEKYLSNWIISPSRGENKTYLKPPPSFVGNPSICIWHPEWLLSNLQQNKLNSKFLSNELRMFVYIDFLVNGVGIWYWYWCWHLYLYVCICLGVVSQFVYHIFTLHWHPCFQWFCARLFVAFANTVYTCIHDYTCMCPSCPYTWYIRRMTFASMCDTSICDKRENGKGLCFSLSLFPDPFEFQNASDTTKEQ